MEKIINPFDITNSQENKVVDVIAKSSQPIRITSPDTHNITFERLGEPLKQLPKQIKPKRKIRKIFIWSLLIQISILITMELFFRDYFFKVLLGWLIAATGFILIPSIKRKNKNV